MIGKMSTDAITESRDKIAKLTIREADLKHLVLKGVEVIPNSELGTGGYGKVYKVKYCELICAAKEIHSYFIEKKSPNDHTPEPKQKQSFIEECLQCSKLRHPNIVQFLGIYYEKDDVTKFPRMVMEIMAYSLDSLVKKNSIIPLQLKFSIVLDVALGLCYLHNQDPPIIHRDLCPNNVLLTEHSRAKISDLGLAKVVNVPGTVNETSRKMSQYPGTRDFMPPETKKDSYSTPMDVFSFALIILSTFNQELPTPKTKKWITDRKKKQRRETTEVERRIEHLNKMTGDAEGLKLLVEECLDNIPENRPDIATVIKKVQALKENVIQDIDAPSLIPAHTSKKHHIAWTTLADLPVPMSFVHAAVQDRKVYVTGMSPIEEASHKVFVYNISTNHWEQLPASGHYYSIPHIIGGRLTIIGGRLSLTNKVTNKVLTFDEASQTWISYYPDMLSARSKPGVVTHKEHVIVAGGIKGSHVQCDIEILNWLENTGWRVIIMQLPVPMCEISCTMSDGKLVIVNYYSTDIDLRNHNEMYSLPASDLISESWWNYFATWPTLTAPNDQAVALVPNSSPLMVLGGTNRTSTVSTTDITTFDSSSNSWKKTESSLTSARSTAAIAAVNDKAFIVIGGCTSIESMESAKSSSLSIVELGQLQ